ncbi:hypothetical protein ACIRJO_03240 [Streptomyces sp. NPDC102394]|uniref:hypothetical protein n=1 Tax=Streptomyces sp. NPDC102394 TaxID=3366167 RepID=UPI00380D9498
MRRTARVLSAAALAGAAVGLPAAAAFADPASEVSPGTASPGGSVTVSVSCESTGGPAPATIDATSQAFDEGTVKLQRVAGDAQQASGVTYRGTARIASATDLEDGGPATGGPATVGPDPAAPDAARPQDTAIPDATVPDASGPDAAGPDAVGPDTVPTDAAAADALGPDTVPTDAAGSGDVTPDPAAPDAAVPDGSAPDGAAPDGTAPDAVGPGAVPPGSVTADSAWTVNGTCPAPPGGRGAAWSATFKVDLGAGGTRRCAEKQRTDGCGTAPVQRGVRAGEGGTFTDSVPALVAGGVLIAGALGAAAHRLRHRDSGTGG